MNHKINNLVFLLPYTGRTPNTQRTIFFLAETKSIISVLRWISSYSVWNKDRYTHIDKYCIIITLDKSIYLQCTSLWESMDMIRYNLLWGERDWQKDYSISGRNRLKLVWYNMEHTTVTGWHWLLSEWKGRRLATVSRLGDGDTVRSVREQDMEMRGVYCNYANVWNGGGCVQKWIEGSPEWGENKWNTRVESQTLLGRKSQQKYAKCFGKGQSQNIVI